MQISGPVFYSLAHSLPQMSKAKYRRVVNINIYNTDRDRFLLNVSNISRVLASRCLTFANYKFILYIFSFVNFFRLNKVVVVVADWRL